MENESAAVPDVIVVEDDQEWVRAVREALEPIGRSVTAARGAGDALRLLKLAERPLLVIGPGVAARDLQWVDEARREADVPVIVVTEQSTPDAASSAFAAGATALIGASPRDVAAASSVTPVRVAPAAPAATALTERELEMLRLVARGLSNVDIGRALWVTEQTVKFHLSRIYRKLHVASRTEAVWFAHEHGLLDGVAGSSKR